MGTTCCPDCAGGKACGKYHVYVIELSEEAAGRRGMPPVDRINHPGRQFYYVGMTAHEPKCRLRQHQLWVEGAVEFPCSCFGDEGEVMRKFGRDGQPGTRGNRLAGEFGIELVWRLVRELNPLSSQQAGFAEEQRLATILRSKGHGVHQA